MLSSMGCLKEGEGRAGGNMRLVEALAEGLPVVYNSVATDIAYSGSGVRVNTATSSTRGDRPCFCLLL